jgi:protein-tyrosine phosphatase
VTTGWDEEPLRVDWIDRSSLRDDRPGRLGMTFLPGKHGASVRYPGRVYRRDLERDLVSLVEAGVTLLVLLVEDGELARWGDLEISAAAASHGLRLDRRPMPDGSAPATVGDMHSILASIARGRDEGDVAVACMGGVGRTGTVVACALVDAGWPPTDAIAEVRRIRHPTAVETDEQMTFVHAFVPPSGRGSSDTVRP